MISGMSKVTAEELYHLGRDLLMGGERLQALGMFERASRLDPENPKVRSYLGLCIAHERRMMGDAIRHCERALADEPGNPDHFLNLGKVYLVFGRASDAVEVFRRGMSIDRRNPEIIAELQAMGIRKKPVIPGLSRDNIVNRYLGLILSRLNLR